jgi:pyruvate carboxylase
MIEEGKQRKMLDSERATVVANKTRIKQPIHPVDTTSKKSHQVLLQTETTKTSDI